MPGNRNRHRHSQQMNTPAGRPIVAVQVNPATLWADQPTIVVNAEICAEPPQQQPQQVQRLKDQVAQLKKSNKDYKKQEKQYKKQCEELAQQTMETLSSSGKKIAEAETKFKTAVVRWDSEREQSEAHTKTMWVESSITDYCLSKSNETMLTFDTLKHPTEMPQGDQIPKAMETHKYLFDRLNTKTKKEGEDLMVGDNPDGYRLTVQKVKGVPQWDGVEEDDPMVNPQMVVHPQFTMTAKDYLSVGGCTRHWLATWKWVEWTHLCDSMELKYEGKHMELWKNYPRRLKIVPQLNTQDIQELKKLITTAEELIVKVSGVSDYHVRVEPGADSKVDKIVNSVNKNIKSIFGARLVKMWTDFLIEHCAKDDNQQRLNEKMWF